MSGSPNEETGIARFYRELRIDPKTHEYTIPVRDIPRGFTSRCINLLGTALATVATVGASAQGICYGVLLSNLSATAASVTLWEGTASTKKLELYLIGNDTIPHPINPNPNAPIIKWQGAKHLKGRCGAAGMRVAVTVYYWSEEP